MTGATEPTYFDLAPTRTYSRRYVRWFPGPHADHADARSGTLRIVLEPAARSQTDDCVDEYGTEEEHETGLPAGARSFLLRNDTDPLQRDVYRTVVGSDARGEVFDRCTCPAGAFSKACKHLDGLSKLIESGAL